MSAPYLFGDALAGQFPIMDEAEDRAKAEQERDDALGDALTYTTWLADECKDAKIMLSGYVPRDMADMDLTIHSTPRLVTLTLSERKDLVAAAQWELRCRYMTAMGFQ